MPNASNLFKFMMYADDTTLYCCLEDINSSNKNEIINNELQKVNKWLVSNKLSLNVNKTKYMLFYKHPKIVNDLNVQINNNSISRVNTFNFLGLYIHSNITWKTHIDHISKKISRVIGILNKMKYIFPTHILLSLYNSLILPHINYCLLSWGKNSDAILLLQKRAMRSIFCTSYRAHTEPLFIISNSLKITEIYKSKILFTITS